MTFAEDLSTVTNFVLLVFLASTPCKIHGAIVRWNPIQMAANLTRFRRTHKSEKDEGVHLCSRFYKINSLVAAFYNLWFKNFPLPFVRQVLPVRGDALHHDAVDRSNLPCATGLISDKARYVFPQNLIHVLNYIIGEWQ